MPLPSSLLLANSILILSIPFCLKTNKITSFLGGERGEGRQGC